MSSNSLVKGVNLSEYHYNLPEERIAKYPLKDRSKSKLLSYNRGQINHSVFENISSLLPQKSHLVFNNTKVIPARLILHKETGARIEVFLLDPIKPSNVYETAMASKTSTEWHVMIGNAKKWKKETTLSLDLGHTILTATRTGEQSVKFTWESDCTFSELLDKAGTIPLPPYLGREATAEDKPRYQTVYSKVEGAVAAPTAGLHFTSDILEELQKKSISTDYLTLHVSAGTFQPIKAKKIEDHPMHKEQVVITKENVSKLLENDKIIAVGTTSLRTLESLYWFGNKLEHHKGADFFIEKLAPYQERPISRNQSLKNVLAYMEANSINHLIGHTEIFIFPGYQFKICNGLITNFHLPGSTLILLVAAMIGEDWEKVYQEALNNDYRFLSYGDSSLLLPDSY